MQVTQELQNKKESRKDRVSIALSVSAHEKLEKLAGIANMSLLDYISDVADREYARCESIINEAERLSAIVRGKEVVR